MNDKRNETSIPTLHSLVSKHGLRVCLFGHNEMAKWDSHCFGVHSYV